MLAQTNAAYPATFILKNIDNSPYDLTNAAIRMQFKSAPGSAAALTATTDDMLTAGIDPTQGQLSLLVPTATMRTIPPGTYFFDALKVVAPENYLLFRGKWIVLPGVTDDASPDLPPLAGRLARAESITIISAASELQVMVAGAAPSVNGLIEAIFGVPAAPLIGARWFYDLSDNNLKVIFSTGIVRNFGSPSPDPTA